MDFERSLARRGNILEVVTPRAGQGWDDIKRRLDGIKSARQKLIDDVVPMPWWEQKARQQLARLLPQLREHLDVEPLSKISVELRQLIFDLRNIMPQILEDARQIDAYASKVETLLQRIEENPGDEGLIYQLDRLQNEEAEKKLNLSQNDQIEALIQAVQSADPKFKETFRNEILDQANRYLDLEGVKIKAARNLLISSVNELRRLKNLYSEIEKHMETTHRLSTTAGYLIRGEELGIISWNTAIGELEQVVAVADLVFDAVEVGRNFADPERLQRLHDDADRLERRFSGPSSPGQGRKSLPYSTGSGLEFD